MNQPCVKVSKLEELISIRKDKINTSSIEDDLIYLIAATRKKYIDSDERQAKADERYWNENP